MAIVDLQAEMDASVLRNQAARLKAEAQWYVCFCSMFWLIITIVHFSAIEHLRPIVKIHVTDAASPPNIGNKPKDVSSR